MPLDEATHRFAFLMQRDLRRFTEAESRHAERGEVLRYDAASRVGAWVAPDGATRSRHFGAVLATYHAGKRTFQWAWTESVKANPARVATHAETVCREGQARSVPQLAMNPVAGLEEDDAITLARLGALVARAQGLLVRRTESGLELVGLFDRPRPTASIADDRRFSVPAPLISEKRNLTPSPRPAPYRSLPPIREVFEPRNKVSAHPPTDARAPSEERPLVSASAPRPTPSPRARVREPARGVFLPVATAALADLARLLPRYQQGLFVATVVATADRARVVVQLVALDDSGVLRALDPSAHLVEESSRMIEADRQDGNGPWRKLTARFLPKANGGATLAVDVV